MAQFIRLGELAGGPNSSSARAISDNGLVVAGTSKTDDGDEAFRWAPADGLVGLGDLNGGSFRSIARGISADGSVVIGQAQNGIGTTAFFWTSESGMQSLGFLTKTNESVANACSADGKVVVGTARVGTTTYAFYWRIAVGLIPIQPEDSSTLGNSEANGISSNGLWLAGSIAPTGPEIAAIWNLESGWIELGDLPGGGAESYAIAVNDDASVAIGNGSSPASGFSYEAFRWENGVMEPLGDLPGGTYQSFATAMSADGSVVVGYSDGTPPPDFRNYDAFIWDRGHGMRKLQTVLTNDYGLDLTGWQLVIPFAISRDGRNIAGSGVNPQGESEAWVVRLGSNCSVDFDGNGFVTGEDFDLYLVAFEAGSPAADFDNDGFVTGDDFDSYVAAFLTGC